jgi:hypothetical protein
MQSLNYAGTNSYPVAIPGIKNAGGSFAVAGILFPNPTSGLDISIGTEAQLLLNMGKFASNGFVTLPKALISGMSISATLQNRMAASQYTFGAKVEDATDVPVVTNAVEGSPSHMSYEPGFVESPCILSKLQGLQLLHSDNSPIAGLCTQSLQCNLGAQPITITDSCTQNWASTIGVGSISGGIQLAANSSGFDVELEECMKVRLNFDCNVGAPEPLQEDVWDILYPDTQYDPTSPLALGRSWQIPGQFMVNGRTGLTVNIASGDVISYSISGQMTIACGCNTAAPISYSAASDGNNVNVLFASPVDRIIGVDTDPASDATLTSIEQMSDSAYTLHYSAPTTGLGIAIYAPGVLSNAITVS